MLRLNDYAAMKPTEQLSSLRALVSSSRQGGRDAARAARIRRFEQRYEMTSAEMLRKLANGECAETAEMSEWLFLLDGEQSRAIR